MNDREEEIENWLENTYDLGIKQASIDIDLRWVQQHFDNLKNERRIYDLIVFTKKIAERESLCLRYDERASIMRRIHRVPTAVFGGTMKKIKG